MHDNGSRSKITVDGTDFRIQEPWPFSSKWYTKKFHGPGVRYEIGICIQTGWIVWVNGPFPCGKWSDLKIALEDLVYMFQGNETAVADRGYRGHPIYFDVPRNANTLQHAVQMALARARHECVNRRFKQWQCMQQRWRHRLAKHGVTFRAVANVEQLKIARRAPWQVECLD